MKVIMLYLAFGILSKFILSTDSDNDGEVGHSHEEPKNCHECFCSPKALNDTGCCFTTPCGRCDGKWCCFSDMECCREHGENRASCQCCVGQTLCCLYTPTTLIEETHEGRSTATTHKRKFCLWSWPKKELKGQGMRIGEVEGMCKYGGNGFAWGFTAKAIEVQFGHNGSCHFKIWLGCPIANVGGVWLENGSVKFGAPGICTFSVGMEIAASVAGCGLQLGFGCCQD